MSGCYSYLINLLFTTRALIIHFVLLQNLTEARNSLKAAGNLFRYLRLRIVSRVLFSIRRILLFCDVARWFTSAFGHSYMNDMIRVRVVILQRTVRELRIMIMKRIQRLVHWDRCMYYRPWQQNFCEMGTFYGFQNNLDSPSLTKVFLSFPIGNLSRKSSVIQTW